MASVTVAQEYAGAALFRDPRLPISLYSLHFSSWPSSVRRTLPGATSATDFPPGGVAVCKPGLQANGV